MSMVSQNKVIPMLRRLETKLRLNTVVGRPREALIGKWAFGGIRDISETGIRFGPRSSKQFLLPDEHVSLVKMYLSPTLVTDWLMLDSSAV